MKNIIVFIVTLLFFSGCISQAPVTNRTQFIMLSPSEEVKMGEKAYNEIISKSKLSTNAQEISRIKNVGSKLAYVSGKNYKWEFNLVEDDQINAFCLPGGKVVVYSGILKLVKNDSQLATVISHEIGHALARHGAERMSMQMAAQSIQKIGNLILGTNPLYNQAFNTAYGLGTQYGVLLPYSRKHEFEADQIGIILMHKAGYNVTEALNFWNEMKNMKSGQEVPEILSTHPNDDSRIENIKKVIKKLYGISKNSYARSQVKLRMTKWEVQDDKYFVIPCEAYVISCLTRNRRITKWSF